MPKVMVLDVRLSGELVATLTNLQDGRTIFAFNEDYIEDDKRPTLSLSYKDPFGGLMTKFRRSNGERAGSHRGFRASVRRVPRPQIRQRQLSQHRARAGYRDGARRCRRVHPAACVQHSDRQWGYASEELVADLSRQANAGAFARLRPAIDDPLYRGRRYRGPEFLAHEENGGVVTGRTDASCRQGRAFSTRRARQSRVSAKCGTQRKPTCPWPPRSAG